MKRLIRWSAALTLAGGILLGSFFGGSSRVLALSDEEVMSILGEVPVFIPVSSDGVPVNTVSEQGEFTPVFISHENAEEYLSRAQSSNPELAEVDLRVLPVSLARVYELMLAAREAQQPPPFGFIPAQEDVEAALTILQQNGQSIEEIPDVPLFVARIGEGENAAFPAVRRGEEEVIPVYFSEEELQTALNEWRQSSPEEASGVTVQVISLWDFVDNLRQSDNPDLARFYLVAPQESLEYVRSPQQQANPEQQPQNQPQQAQPQ